MPKSTPFSLDGPVTRLARSYLSVAAKKPNSWFTEGQPLNAIDNMALEFLESRSMILRKDRCFQATWTGVLAHKSFLTAGR